MAIASTGLIRRLPFGSRERFGTPYPEGIAAGHVQLTGDATGDPITVAWVAEAGYIFRLELVHSQRSDIVGTAQVLLTAHSWIADKGEGFGAGTFDLSWYLTDSAVAANGFTQYRMRTDDMIQVRRMPIGAPTTVAAPFLAQHTVTDNINTTVYNFNIIFTYWNAEALYRPGFLQSFWEAPVVPTPAVIGS